MASIDDADVQQSWVGNYESESRSETAGQQGVRNVSPRNCLPRNVARKKTSAGRDIETRHALQTHPPTNSCDWGGKSRWLVPPNHRLVSCLPPLLNSSSSSFLFPSFRRGVSRRGEIVNTTTHRGNAGTVGGFSKGRIIRNRSSGVSFEMDRSGERKLEI